MNQCALFSPLRAFLALQEEETTKVGESQSNKSIICTPGRDKGKIRKKLKIKKISIPWKHKDLIEKDYFIHVSLQLLI